MVSVRPVRRLRSLVRRRRIAAAIALVAVAVCSVGVPRAPGRRTTPTERFPCEDCACGCPDAESCWRDCCCYDTGQKVAWARREGVPLPALILAAAEAEADDAAEGAGVEACAADAAEALPPCCRARLARGKLESSPMSAAVNAVKLTRSGPVRRDEDRATAPPRRFSWVNFLAAARCRGQGGGVAVLPVCLPPVVKPFEHLLAALGPADVRLPSLYRSPALAIATPPPNAATL